MTSASGEVAYPAAWAASASRLARGLDRHAGLRVARRKDLPQYKATLDYLKQRIGPAHGDFRGIHPLLRGPGPVSGRRGGLGEMEQAAGPAVETAQQPDGSFRGQFGRASARRCRCWRWRSIIASCRSTNDRAFR